MNWNLGLRRTSAICWCSYVLFIVTSDRGAHFSAPMEPLEILWQIPLLLLGCYVCHRASCETVDHSGQMRNSIIRRESSPHGSQIDDDAHYFGLVHDRLWSYTVLRARCFE